MILISVLTAVLYGLWQANELRRGPSEDAAAKLRMSAFHFAASLSGSWCLTTALYRHLSSARLTSLLLLLPLMLESVSVGRVMLHLVKLLETAWLLVRAVRGSRPHLAFLVARATGLGILVELLPTFGLVLLLVVHLSLVLYNSVCT